MCAFIPASANWIGAIPFRERASNSGAHAFGGFATASKKRFANSTSSRARKRGSRNPCGFTAT